jgi:hypothetical protein
VWIFRPEASKGSGAHAGSLVDLPKATYPRPMDARVFLGLAGLIASGGVFVASFGTWIQTSAGGFTGSTTIGLLLAVGAALAAVAHVVLALGRLRWSAFCGVVAGGSAVVVGVLITIAVHVANRASGLVAHLVGGSNRFAGLASGAHVARGWGGTGLLLFGFLLFATSLVRLFVQGGRSKVAWSSVVGQITAQPSPGDPAPNNVLSSLTEGDDLL